MSTHDADPAEAIIFECLEQLAANEPDVIESACRRYPQHADSIRERLDVLERGFRIPSAAVDVVDQLRP